VCLPRIDRILGIEGQEATVDGEGGPARVSLLCVPDARVGDHVMIHAGHAIRVLDGEEAAERLSMIATVKGEAFDSD
jgi:hydrogenase expression/formation protein HypC